jgi:hypothetical protein
VDIPGILGSLQVPASTAPSAPGPPSALPGQTLEATLEAVLPGGLLLRLSDGTPLQAQGALPFPVGSALSLEAVPAAGGGLRLQVTRATPPPRAALLAPLESGEAAGLLARVQADGALGPLADLLRNLLQSGPAAADQPETWAGWMKEAIRTLADPTASPDESAFHRLQAKEGTGWFELPLPWAQGEEPLRLWVEEDRDPARTGSDPVHRVFLSVPFSRLGEVRLGLEQRSAGLKARLWVRDPGQVSDLRQELEAELASLGRPVDLQVFALPPGSPDLRALAGASPLQALG